MTTIDARKIAAEKINGVILMRKISQTGVPSPTLSMGIQKCATMCVNGHSKVRYLKRLKLNCLLALQALQLIDLGYFVFLSCVNEADLASAKRLS